MLKRGARNDRVHLDPRVNMRRITTKGTAGLSGRPYNSSRSVRVSLPLFIPLRATIFSLVLHSTTAFAVPRPYLRDVRQAMRSRQS